MNPRLSLPRFLSNTQNTHPVSAIATECIPQLLPKSLLGLLLPIFAHSRTPGYVLGLRSLRIDRGHSSPKLCNAQHTFSVGRPATAWITGMEVVIVLGIQLKVTRTTRQAMFGSTVMLAQDQFRVTAPYTSYNHQSFLILRRKHKQPRCIQSTPSSLQRHPHRMCDWKKAPFGKTNPQIQSVNCDV
jgi:hypothetical protein